jgi:hypothetical protein
MPYQAEERELEGDESRGCYGNLAGEGMRRAWAGKVKSV